MPRTEGHHASLLPLTIPVPRRVAVTASLEPRPLVPDDLIRPGWACCLCRPPTVQDGYWAPAHAGYVTCDGCLERLRQAMGDVGSRYGRLNPTPAAGATAGSRGAPGFASRSPASDHVIAFRDPRSSQDARVWLDRAGRACREDERPPVSVRGELDILAWDVAERLGMDGPNVRADVGDLLRFLDNRLDFVTRDVDLTVAVAATVRALQSALRPVSGDPRPRYIGHCPNVIESVPDLGFRPAYDEDPGVQVRCGARLHAPLLGDTVACRACGARWLRSAWMELGAALQAAA